MGSVTPWDFDFPENVRLMFYDGVITRMASAWPPSSGDTGASRVTRSDTLPDCPSLTGGTLQRRGDGADCPGTPRESGYCGGGGIDQRQPVSASGHERYESGLELSRKEAPFLLGLVKSRT